MENFICPECGRENYPGVVLCSKCGAVLCEDSVDVVGSTLFGAVGDVVFQDTNAPCMEHDLKLKDFRIEFNDNRIYIGNYNSILNFRITNLADNDLKPRIKINSRLIDESWQENIKPGDSKDVNFEFLAGDKYVGRHSLVIELSYYHKKQPVVFTCRTCISILHQDYPASRFIDNLEKLRPVDVATLGIGNNIDLIPKLKILVNESGVEAVKDFDMKLMPESYREFNFELAYNKTVQIQPFFTDVGIDERFSMNVPRISKASLYISDDDINHVLVSGKEVKFGRDYDNDIILRYLPIDKKDSENHKKSMVISRFSHFVLRITSYGLKLIDKNSTNGTYSRNKKIRKILGIESGIRQEISIAKTLSLSILTQPFYSPSSAALAKYLQTFKCSCGPLWKSAEKSKISSVKIERLNNLADEEAYVIFYNCISIGSSKHNSICIKGDDIEPVHCRILNIDSRLYLEVPPKCKDCKDDPASSDLKTSVKVNGKPVNSCQLVPLDFGMNIEIGSKNLLFRKYEQKHIGKKKGKTVQL
jgi:zinc ribbon protein/FHA domain-containing protein